MFDPADSIDGLGLTFADLSERGCLHAIFRKQALALSVEQRQAIAEALSKSKGLSDDNQSHLRAMLNITPAE